MKFLKVGRVAIITHGRFAGKKVRFSTKFSRALQDRVDQAGGVGTTHEDNVAVTVAGWDGWGLHEEWPEQEKGIAPCD